MQRFQVAYHLKAIPEVHLYLDAAFQTARRHGDLQDLYRRRYVFLRRIYLNTKQLVVFLSSPNKLSIPLRRLRVKAGSSSPGASHLSHHHHPSLHRRRRQHCFEFIWIPFSFACFSPCFFCYVFHRLHLSPLVCLSSFHTHLTLCHQHR